MFWACVPPVSASDKSKVEAGLRFEGDQNRRGVEMVGHARDSAPGGLEQGAPLSRCGLIGTCQVGLGGPLAVVGTSTALEYLPKIPGPGQLCGGLCLPQ